MELKTVRMQIPEGANLILGHSHFIKTVEDLYEIIVGTVPQMKFCIAFNEASMARLVRVEGNGDELKNVAAENAQALAAGHVFVIVIKDGYPINILNRVKDCPEVARVLCATANPLEVIVAETDQGRGRTRCCGWVVAPGNRAASRRRRTTGVAAQDRLQAVGRAVSRPLRRSRRCSSNRIFPPATGRSGSDYSPSGISRGRFIAPACRRAARWAMCTNRCREPWPPGLIHPSRGAH